MTSSQAPHFLSARNREFAVGNGVPLILALRDYVETEGC